jgi:alkyl hydroperoxide reductase subunit D
MSLETLRETLPDYAKDLRLNISTLLGETTLTEVQKAGTFIACALASRNATLIRATIKEFEDKISSENMTAAKAAASIMGMNNIYYRFVHLAEHKDYKTMPAKLRMNIIANPGADKIDFELWCLAVSAINGCGMCIDSHDTKLRGHGVSNEIIQTSIRIASVMHAVAATLDGEEAMTG